MPKFKRTSNPFGDHPTAWKAGYDQALRDVLNRILSENYVDKQASQVADEILADLRANDPHGKLHH